MRITIDRAAVRGLENAAKQAAVNTLEALYADLVSSQAMPFDTGKMQNDMTHAEATETGAVLVTGSVQARRLYYHPEYEFQTGKNRNAGAYWLRPYISGEKSGFVPDTFARLMRENTA